ERAARRARAGWPAHHVAGRGARRGGVPGGRQRHPAGLGPRSGHGPGRDRHALGPGHQRRELLPGRERARLTGAASAMTASPDDFWREILATVRDLDGLSYYELLGVPRGSDAAAISDAYYALVRRIHPDRHAREPDGARTSALVRLY